LELYTLAFGREIGQFHVFEEIRGRFALQDAAQQQQQQPQAAA
jgi:hypothetical protein